MRETGALTLMAAMVEDRRPDAPYALLKLHIVNGIALTPDAGQLALHGGKGNNSAGRMPDHAVADQNYRAFAGGRNASTAFPSAVQYMGTLRPRREWVQKGPEPSSLSR